MRTLIAFVFLCLAAVSVRAQVALEPFNDPAKVIMIPLKLGLKPTYGAKPTWKDLGMGWTSMTKVITHKGRLSRVGDIDNDVTCLFYSDSKEHVRYVRVTANCFNKDGEKTTLDKWGEVTNGLVDGLGIPHAAMEIPMAPGQMTDTDTYTIELKKHTYNIGYGWEWTLTSK